MRQIRRGLSNLTSAGWWIVATLLGGSVLAGAAAIWLSDSMSRWESIGIAETIYGVVVAIGIFALSVDREIRVGNERSELRELISLLTKVAAVVEDGLAGKQLAAVADYLGLQESEVGERTEVVLKSSTTTHKRVVVLSDGLVLRLGSAAGNKDKRASDLPSVERLAQLSRLHAPLRGA